MKNLKAPKKNMRQSGKTAGKTISTPARKRTATIVQKIPGPNGGQTNYRFPMPDKAHARAALADLPKAKNLTGAQKAQIRNRANRMLGRA